MSRSNVEIGRNIRDLRNGFGETQEELGNILGRGKTAISMFESGERQIDNKDIQKIAFHYGIPIDALLNGDFSNFKLNEAFFTDENLFSYMVESFPYVYSEKAMKDPYFAQGYYMTEEIMAETRNSGVFLVDTYIDALEAYYLSVELSKTTESAVNILCLTYSNFVSICDYYDNKFADTVADGMIADKRFLPKYLLKDESDANEEATKVKKDYAEDVNADILEFIELAKRTKKYADIADYYLALGYVCGLFDSEYGEIFNKGIGSVMMSSFAKIGNKYAKRYLEYLDKAYTKTTTIE